MFFCRFLLILINLFVLLHLELSHKGVLQLAIFGIVGSSVSFTSELLTQVTVVQ